TEEGGAEVDGEEDGEPEGRVRGADDVGIEERHERPRNRAGHARHHVGRQENAKRPVAQRPADAGHEGIRRAGDEVRTLPHAHDQHRVEEDEQNAEERAEKGEHAALVPHPLEEQARRDGGDDRAEDAERLAHAEEHGALVVIERQLGSERMVGKNVEGVEEEVEDEGDAEPAPGRWAGEGARWAEEGPERERAERGADRHEGAPPSPARTRPIREPADERIGERIEGASDRDRDGVVTERKEVDGGSSAASMGAASASHAPNAVSSGIGSSVARSAFVSSPARSKLRKSKIFPAAFALSTLRVITHLPGCDRSTVADRAPDCIPSCLL